MNYGAKIFCFFSGKGGVGKSHVCASTGLALSSLNHSVLWIDLDLGWRNLDFLLQVDKKIVFDLTHILQGACSWRDTAVSIRQSRNSHLIAGTLIQNYPPNLLHTIKIILSEAQKHYDYILIDLGSGFDPLQESILELCDYPVLVSTSDPSSLRCADKILGMITGKKEPIWIVNQCKNRKELITSYGQDLSYNIELFIPNMDSSDFFWKPWGRSDKTIIQKMTEYIQPNIKNIVEAKALSFLLSAD